MRGYFFCAASLVAAVISGGNALAQAPAEDYGASRGQAGGSTADDAQIPPIPFSGFDFDKLWEAPFEGGGEENLGLVGRKARGAVGPLGMPTPAPVVAPKFGTASARELKQALAPKPAPEALRTQRLDELFDRLRTAGDEGDAQRIAASIERVWLHSDSDTASLLMQRATVSMQAENYPLALSLFDKLVALEPNWAEAWNQRATTRFLTGDTDGAMADIDRVIRLEPRHFGALAGMGVILQAAGLEKSALEIFKKVLGLYPLEPGIQKLVEKLTLEVEGQDI
ncbi:MAG: tetratricopeptide repeat protein [Methylocella sp.]